jgi:hypothetical protein
MIRVIMYFNSPGIRGDSISRPSRCEMPIPARVGEAGVSERVWTAGRDGLAVGKFVRINC